MANVTLSLFAGAGAQFLDNSGNVLTGGLIYTYAAGTTTPLAAYTSNLGATAHSNPIILDASGRVPGGEIWLTTGLGYKFVLKDTNNVLIGTYDNIPSSAQPPIINDASSVSYEQGYTVTAGSFVIGNTYLITSIGSTNFQSIGAASNTVGILFTATGVGTGTGTAKFSRTVQAKLQESISVKDFGAKGDGTTDDTTAIQAALTYAGTIKSSVYFPATNSSYLISNSLTVPDYVTVHGDGYGSYILQNTLNKNGFNLGNNCSVKDVRVKIADGNNTDFVNCIYAYAVKNPTIENCYLIPGDLGGCGIQANNCQQVIIKNNRIYGGKWTSGAGPAASASDILFYSYANSQRHIIDGNFCLSNNSQGIFVDALGYDSDIIVSNNICVTLDPATCVEGGAWSEIASGGARRHGIIGEYNNDAIGGPRSLITNNICRNTKWTGIYKQGTVGSQIIINNNNCSNNGYDTSSSLSAGIYVSQVGGEIIAGNSILNFQNTLGNAGGIVINGYGSNEISLISNNVIKNSLGNGIFMSIQPRKININANQFINNALTDICFLPSAGNANVGEIFVQNNFIQKNVATSSAMFFDLQNSTLTSVIQNNLIFGKDNTIVNDRNTAIYIRSIVSPSLVKVKNNIINNFYYAYFCEDYWTTSANRNKVILDSNNIIDCYIGFYISATTSVVVIPVVNNVFDNVTTQISNGGGFVAGYVVNRTGNNLQWYNNAAPTVGTWALGDRVINNSPAVGSPKAWTCTVAGNPGTWVSEGNL
jgi:hypothetical protein